MCSIELNFHTQKKWMKISNKLEYDIQICLFHKMARNLMIILMNKHLVIFIYHIILLILYYQFQSVYNSFQMIERHVNFA